jgi:hypothetical protein
MVSRSVRKVAMDRDAARPGDSYGALRAALASG